MTKNDVAWKDYFEKTNAIKKIDHNGYLYVTADDLKKFTNREPRLLVKHDTLSERPSGFSENNLAIFPTKNGEYVLFRDPDEKSYYKFSDDELEMPVNIYQSQVDLHQFDSYPGGQSLSESQAIDFAYISSLLRTITNEKTLDLVIRGRIFSGNFGFSLPATKYRVNVSSVQIEVDAGYESENSIYLIEAKIGKRDDFHIRQLYYPFLEWSQRSHKRIVPIFLVYTNTKYYFYEFNFSKDFGEIKLVRKLCYSLNEFPIADINLPSLLRTVRSEEESSLIPYPQANDLDKVIDLLSLVNNGINTKTDIAESFEFDERQSDYYANAARYLDLLEKDQNRFLATNTGKKLLHYSSAAEKTLLVVTQLLKHPTFRRALTLLAERNLDLDLISNNEISEIVETNTALTGSTPGRRASTVRSWLRWILLNGRFSF